MIDFDITCTATLRPELLEKTLSSHVKYLFKKYIKEAKLIINIDLAGCEEKDQMKKLMADIKDIIHRYPFRDIKYRVALQPHFPTAFLWCMNMVTSNLFFHLEEDWEMLYELDFKEMVHLFANNEDLAHLRLSMFKSEEKQCKNWDKFLLWNGRYFKVKFHEKCIIGWAGHPSLNRTSFIRSILPFIDPLNNPEKQIKGKIHPEITEAIMNHQFGSYHPQNSPPSIRDIGRQWMVENGYVKKGNKAWFKEWEKVD